MSFWNRIIDTISGADSRSALSRDVPCDASRYCFVDVEVGLKDKTIHDIGALRWDSAVYHSANQRELMTFLKDVNFVCGHNIINHDAKYLFGEGACRYQLVDTLFLSPLLFPERPYHHLLKDDKLLSEQMNNPVNDCEKARDLLMDEIAKWKELTPTKQSVFSTLLQDSVEFKGFLAFVNAKPDSKELLADLIRTEYAGRICAHADIERAVRQQPCELAYALALIDTTDHRSITPPWVLHNFPNVENIVQLLRHTKCPAGCAYCNKSLDVHHNLKQFFGFDNFRTYDEEPLQENAARAAVERKSLLAIFPTGGGKSLAFQLPALMEGRSVHGLQLSFRLCSR